VELSTDEPATTYYTLDGSEPDTDSAVYSEPLEVRADTTLKFFSEDPAGNREGVGMETYIIEESSETSDTFASIAPEDGFVGRYTADGLGAGVQKLGDKGMYNSDTYRTVLSFDTSALPDSARITEATLRVYRRSLTGSAKSISVDLEEGTFGRVGLEQSDYGVPASTSDAASLSVPVSNGEYTEVSLSPEALENINTTGRTQLRLAAVTPTNFAPDVLEIYGGESDTYAPRLTVSR
jgi:hypothetical protein